MSSYYKRSKDRTIQKKFKQNFSVIKIFLIIIWLSGAFIFSFKLAGRYRTYQMAEQEYKELNQNIWKDQDKSNLILPSFLPTIPHTSPYLQLKKINPDYQFWLTIPGTSIHYPVVRSPHPGYYLNHTFQRTENPSGSLFIQEDAPVPGHGNTVIFGHNMKDKTMFSDLKKYKSAEYYKAHPIIFLYYKERWYKAKIFSIQFRHESDLDCYEKEFNNQTQKQKFINNMKASSIHPITYTPSASEPFITLSTCYGQTQRMIVQASVLCYTDN